VRSRFSVSGTIWLVGICRLGFLPGCTGRGGTARYGGQLYTVFVAATCHELAYVGLSFLHALLVNAGHVRA
jgi:hypothetical protein